MKAVFGLLAGARKENEIKEGPTGFHIEVRMMKRKKRVV